MKMQNSNPKFSVIIPIYNKEPHIGRAIKSVLAQTYQNFELILVCDPSTDNSYNEVKRFKDPRIRIFNRERPGPGGYAARNLGIKKAKGKWIAFLDADDEWMPNHLKRYNVIINNNPKVKFLCSAYQIKNENGKIEHDTYYKGISNIKTHKLSFLEYLKASTKGFRPAWTSVVCIKNTPYAKELFPDGKTKRSGDKFAWVYFLAKERKMIWSNHVGATYFRDSINMVTKGSPSYPFILKYEYDLIFPTLKDKNEMKYFVKYINRRLVMAYFRNLYENNKKVFSLIKYLHFKYDQPFYIKSIIRLFIPIKIQLYLIKKIKPIIK